MPTQNKSLNRYAGPAWSPRKTSQVKGHKDQGHGIFNEDLRLVNTKAFKVSYSPRAF